MQHWVIECLSEYCLSEQCHVPSHRRAVVCEQLAMSHIQILILLFLMVSHCLLVAQFGVSQNI